MGLEPLTPAEIALAAGGEPGSNGETPVPPKDAAPIPGDTSPQDQPSPETETPSTPPEKEPVLDEWLEDDLVNDAGTFGLSKEDIVGLGSRDQVEAHLRLLNVTSARRQTPVPPQIPEQPGPEDGPTSVESATPQSRLPGFNEDGTADLKFWKDQYEDDTGILGLVNGFNAQQANGVELAKQFGELRQQSDTMIKYLQESFQAQQESSFMDFLDMDDPELFGLSRDSDGNNLVISDEHAAHRKQVWDAQENVQQTMRSQGINPDLANRASIVKRAKQLALGSTISERDLHKRQESLRNHSRQRRPVGASAGKQIVSGQPEKQPDAPVLSAEQIANEPAISNWWIKTQQENGVVA